MKSSFASSLPLLVLAAALLAGGCSKAYGPASPYGAASGPPPASQPNTVVMSNIAFSPASITVTAGTTITWQNNDSINHTSTSDNGAWDTGMIAPGQSGRTVFNTPGTYTYHCTVHAMMTGTVIVR